MNSPDLIHQRKLDALRGTSSIVVVLAHVQVTFLQRLLDSHNKLAIVCGILARHAVLSFFLLSGFLITESLRANVRRNKGLDPIQYMTSRIARIYPPLVGAILLVLAIAILIHVLGLPGAVHYGIPSDQFAVRDRFAVSLRDVVLSLLMDRGMLDADGPLWSLYIEFHLYVVALLVALAVTAVRRSLSVGWAVVAIALIAFFTVRDSQFAFFGAIWLIGVFIAFARHRLNLYKQIVRSIAWLIISASVIAALVAPRLISVTSFNPWMAFATQFGLSVAYGYFIFIAATSARQVPAWLVTTAEFSYSLYVIHFPLFLLVLSLTQDWMGASLGRTLIVCGAAVALAIVVAFWFARFFENQRRFAPFIRNVLVMAVPLLHSIPRSRRC